MDTYQQQTTNNTEGNMENITITITEVEASMLIHALAAVQADRSEKLEKGNLDDGSEDRLMWRYAATNILMDTIEKALP